MEERLATCGGIEWLDASESKVVERSEELEEVTKKEVKFYENKQLLDCLPMVILVEVVIGVVTVVAGLLAMNCIKEDWWRLDIFLKYLNL